MAEHVTIEMHDAALPVRVRKSSAAASMSPLQASDMTSLTPLRPRSWAGEVKNVSLLVTIGVAADGFRQILGVAEGEKEGLEG